MDDKQDFKELIRDRCLYAFLYLPPGVYPDTEIRNFFRWTIDFSVISSSLDFDRLENDYTTWPKFILLCPSASDAADILQQQHGPQGGILYFPCETSSDIPNAWQKHKYQLQTPSLLCSSVPAYASSLSAASFTKFRTSYQVGAEAVVTKRPSIPEKHKIDDQKPPIAIGPIMPSSFITVSNIPAGACKDLLIHYFENTKRSGGDEVVGISYDVDSRVAVIEFENYKVVENVLEKCPHELMKQKITVENYIPPTQGEHRPMIKVSNIPAGASEDLLINYFENTRKSGGEEVMGIEYDVERRMAVIEFEDDKVIEKVLNKCPHVLMKQEVIVERYIPFTSSTQKKQRPMIKVSNIPAGASEDLLINYFENTRKSGGDEVVGISYDVDSRVAVIEFEDNEVVEKVLNKCRHVLINQKVTVERYIPLTSSTQEEQRPMIKVSNIPAGASEDLLINYFENTRKSGGDGVKDMSYDMDSRVAVIEFEDNEVVERVLQKDKHMLSNQEITVEKYISVSFPKEKKMYEDQFLVTNVNESTTLDSICNFLEHHAQTNVLRARPGKDRGTYIIQFEDKPDFNNLVKKSKVNSLDGNYLHLEQIPTSNCILVWGTAKLTTLDHIETYFDHKRRCGAEGVKRAVKLKDNNGFLVFYEDPNVLNDVLARKHTIDGKVVKVRIYYDFEGETEEEGGTVFKIPDPIIIQDMDVRKLMFIKQSQMHLKAIELQLQKEHAVLHLPDNNDAPIRITCSLTPETDNWRNILKVWRKSTRESFHKYMNMLDTRTVPVLQDLWPEVIDKINGTGFQDESVLILQNKTKSSLELVGITKSVDNMAAKIDVVIKDIKEGYERRNKQVVEEKLENPYFIQLLIKKGFQERMEEKFQKLNVKLDPSTGIISITGSSHDVEKVMIELYGLKDAMKTLEFSKNFTQAQFDLLSKDKEIEKYCQDILNNRNIVAIWVYDFNKKSILIHAFSDDDLVTVCDVFISVVTSNTFPVKPEGFDVQNTSEWGQFEKNMKSTTKFNFVVIWDHISSTVEVVLVDVDYHNAFETIQDFIENNTISEKSYEIKKGEFHLIEKYGKDRLSHIQQEFQASKVKCMLWCGKLITKGTSIGLDKVHMKIVELLKSIVKENHFLSKPGIFQIMESQEVKNQLERAMNMHSVFIIDHSSGSDDDDDNNDDNSNSANPRKGQLVKEVITCDRKQFKYHVMLGDITELPVDVLVNSAHKSLAGTGGLAFDILRMGGKDILIECEKHITKNGNLQTGEVFVSGPGNLKCKAVIHAVIPVYDQEGNPEDELMDVVELTMREAENGGFSSVAIPALGSEINNFPMDITARCMLEGIEKYFERNPKSSLHNIYLCDVLQEKTAAFTKQLKKRFKKLECYPRYQGESDLTTQKAALMVLKDEKPNKEPLLPTVFAETPMQELSQSSIQISIVKGKIAQFQADVLVNTTSKELNLTLGSVSSSILVEAGPEIQSEIKNQYPHGIDCGDMAITKGHNMKYDLVFHGALPAWYSKAETILQKFIIDCLKQADSRNKTSIAFPALGSGNLRYPKDVVAKAMFHCVNQFGQDNPRSSLKEVFFVIYEMDMETIRAFEEVEKTYMSQNPTIFVRNPRLDEVLCESNDCFFKWKSVKDKISTYEGKIGNLEIKISEGELKDSHLQAIVDFSNGSCDSSQDNDTKSYGVNITKVAGKGHNYIIHVNLDRFPTLSKAFCKLFEEAQRYDISTIALPFIENKEFPEDFINEIKQCESGKRNIREIHIIVKDQDQVHEFFKQMCKSSCNGSWKEVLSSGKTSYKIQVFGFSKNDVSNAIFDFENILDKYVESKKICNDLTDKQEQAEKITLQDVEKTHEHELDGIVKTDLEEKVVENMEESLQAKNIFAPNYIQWSYIDIENGNEFNETYPDVINLKIEEAFCNQEKEVVFCDKDDKKYVVDLTTMEEYAKDDPQSVVKVIRRQQIQVSQEKMPYSWNEMKDKENLNVIPLTRTDPEYQTVEKNFQLSFGTNMKTIVGIQRIQNKTLYQKYASKRKLMERQRQTGIENTLWHEADCKMVNFINAYGFNRCFCNKNATEFGDGVHFAVNPAYLSQSTFDPKDASKVKQMYQSKVLTGEFCQGTQGMRVPPPKSHKSDIYYDSVVDNIETPNIFVIFYDTQAYPEYLISFKD